VKLCETEIQAGEKKRTSLIVNDRINIPLWLIAGGSPGPALVVAAGVHGGEYVGVLAARALFDQIDASQLAGQLIVLPVVNEQGFYKGLKQIVPGDGKNLNRVFPGKSGGTASEQLAYALEKYIYPQADFLIDLHGADINEKIEPLVFFSKIAADFVVAKSRAAAACMKVGYRIPSTAKNGLYSYAAQCGIPGLLLEIGGQGRWEETEVEQCLGSVYRLMGHLGMLEQGGPNSAQQEALEAVYEEASTDGFWYPTIDSGQQIAAGMELGVLKDLEGERLQTIHARFDGIVMYYTTALGVCKDDPLIAYCRCK